MTATNKQTLEQYLTPGTRVHLIGIGGVSMRPLGLVLRHMGLKITGSDMNASVMTDDLIESGIPVFIGHRAENIRGAQCIIRTAAVHNDNPEVAAARAAGIPVFERAQAWALSCGPTATPSVFPAPTARQRRPPWSRISSCRPSGTRPS